jgi:hypothetical protein
MTYRTCCFTREKLNYVCRLKFYSVLNLYKLLLLCLLQSMYAKYKNNNLKRINFGKYFLSGFLYHKMKLFTKFYNRVALAVTIRG